MEPSLIQLLTVIPYLYIISTAILISWGIVNLAALVMIIKNVRNSDYINSSIRVNDRIHLVVNIIILVVNIILINMSPLFLLHLSDMMLIVNFWIAIYYGFVAFTCINDWYTLIFKGAVRIHERNDGDPYVLR